MKKFNQLEELTAEQFVPLWDTDRSKIIQTLAKRFGVPNRLCRLLAELDAETLAKSQKAGSAPRMDSLKARIIARFSVIEKNRRAIQKVAKAFKSTAGRNFLDVGCGMGMTMHDARRLGFNRCDGLEISAPFVYRGKIVEDHYKDPNVRIYLSDFLTHSFDCKYDLITVFDVFEHILDRDLALQRISDLLTDDGVAYIYQGNSRSSEIVRGEPHYRVPALSLLDNADQIRILKGMGKIQSDSDFVISKWPTLDLFGSNPSLYPQLNVSGRNIRGDRPHGGYDAALRLIRGMVRDPKVWEFPGSDRLGAEDKAMLLDALTALADEMTAAMETKGEDFVYQEFLIGGWEVLLSKSPDAPHLDGFKSLQRTEEPAL